MNRDNNEDYKTQKPHLSRAKHLQEVAVMVAAKDYARAQLHKFASPKSFQNDRQLRQLQLRTRISDWWWRCGGLMPLGHSNQVAVSSRRMISMMNTTTIAIRIPTKTPIVTMIMTVIVCKNQNSQWQKPNSKKKAKRKK